VHPKDSDLIPKGTVVEIIKGFNKGRHAVIVDYGFLKDGKNFLNYLAHIEGRDDEGMFALYADDIRLL
jgi:hypothetical protein